MRPDLRVGAPVRFPRAPAEGLGGRVSARLEAGRGAQSRSSELRGRRRHSPRPLSTPRSPPLLSAQEDDLTLRRPVTSRAVCLSLDGCGALTFPGPPPARPSPGAPSPLLSGSFAGWPQSTAQTGPKKKGTPKKVGRGPFEIISLIRAEGSLL